MLLQSPSLRNKSPRLKRLLGFAVQDRINLLLPAEGCNLSEVIR
jgi:hypothetical protein